MLRAHASASTADRSGWLIGITGSGFRLTPYGTSPRVYTQPPEERTVTTEKDTLDRVLDLTDDQKITMLGYLYGALALQPEIYLAALAFAEETAP
jgi:hypothetical protein